MHKPAIYEEIIKSKATLVIRHRKVLSEVWKVIFTYTQWVYSTIDSILQFSLWSEFFMRNFSEEIWFPISFETQFSCLYCRYFWRKVMVIILDSFCDKAKVSILNYVFNITESDTQLNRLLISNISFEFFSIQIPFQYFPVLNINSSLHSMHILTHLHWSKRCQM